MSAVVYLAALIVGGVVVTRLSRRWFRPEAPPTFPETATIEERLAGLLAWQARLAHASVGRWRRITLVCWFVIVSLTWGGYEIQQTDEARERDRIARCIDFRRSTRDTFAAVVDRLAQESGSERRAELVADTEDAVAEQLPVNECR